MTEKKSTSWKVATACVVVKLFGQDRYLYKGAILPVGVPAADITRLSNIGLIVETTDTAPVEVDDREDAAAAADKAASTDVDGATDAGAAKASRTRSTGTSPAK